MKNITILLLILFSIQNQAQTYFTEPITGTRAYKGLANKAVLEIKLATGNSSLQIQKPLIVVEDFDSGLLGKENPLGEVEYKDFNASINAYPSNLPSQLNTYDVIYINFMNGSDYMQRNAYLVEDIIKWVNDQKAISGSTKKNVVLGQGMGGLIARYALKDMENNYEDHKTSLYISHDAPHQGANVPLAVQYFLRHVANEKIQGNLGDINVNAVDGGISANTDDLSNLFEQPGTQQLMINYVNSNFVNDNPKGTAWREELKNLGYPQIRNIAISNGSHCANTQPFEPSDNLFSLTAHVKTTFLADLLMAITPIIRFSTGHINPEDIKELEGRNHFDANFYGKALPVEWSSGQVYHGSMSYQKRFWLIPLKTINLITPRDFSVPSGLSYDYYPGGQKELFTDPISGSVSNKDSWTSYFVSVGAALQIQNSFDFIPTPSGLDVGSGQTSLSSNDFSEKYNKLNPPFASKVPAFHNYTTSFNASGSNENHISFNTRNGDWLATELDNDADNTQNFDCTYVCEGIEIAGPDVICSSGVYSYSSPSWATGANWSIIQGANLVTLSGNTLITTLTPVGTGSGEVILEGTFTSPCGSVSETRNIWVGNPPNFGLHPIINGDCWNVQVVAPNMSPLNYIGVSEVKWTKLSGDGTLYPDTVTQVCPPVFYIPGNGWTITFKVELINDCGRTEQILTLNNPTVTPPPGMENYSRKADTGSELEDTKDDPNNKYYSIYPNPSADIVNIETKNKDTKTEQENFVSGELFDMKGAFIAKIPIHNINTSFSVKCLSKGVYILKIYNGYQTENHKIVVE